MNIIYLRCLSAIHGYKTGCFTGASPGRDAGLADSAHSRGVLIVPALLQHNASRARCGAGRSSAFWLFDISDPSFHYRCRTVFIMKLLSLFVVTLSLLAESKSSPLGQDGRKEDLLIQCLVEVLTKVVSQPDGTSLQPECKDILQKQGSSHTLLMKKNEEEMLPLEQDEKRQERESKARAQEIINELLKTNEEKREDMDEERSQEEFPNYYKRHHLLTSKEKREDPDNERSQEEFPQKRHSLFSTKEKREDQDEEQSQEEFPTYEQKRHLFLTSKEKRDDPDYDRSQEDFPSYVYKRYHDEDGGTEKQIWKPHKYHYKRYDDSSNEDFAELNSQEKRFEEDESAKQYWNPIQRYHHKKHHKHDGDSSDEEMESEEKEKRVSWTRESEEGSEESEEREKRVWKPSYKNHHMKLFHKQGKFENENDANLHHSLETSKRRSPEEEEEELIAQELNENKHHYDSQEQQKRHHSDAEEKKQEKEAELRYLTKKRNELEERLLKEGEVYDKRNPWIYRGYYHPAWYKRIAEGNEGLVGPSKKLEELVNALRYKIGLLSEKEPTEGEKAYLHQRALTPEELKELEKLAFVEQQAQIN
ncbi:secretogranin-1 [Pangasianodon hypophthalmus]|uniref:secretogranin-1 n=1 Tax=Pangasianodon hypophthalmus TaxID=310915 RepID=UPI0023079901|nr:secretogranin-1 [Pangasianodon hypophthalmus]